MNILIAFLLLAVAVALFLKRPIQIEIKHTHEYPPVPEPELIKDPNDPDAKGENISVEKTMEKVITTLNAIMNGGEIPNDETDR